MASTTMTQVHHLIKSGSLQLESPHGSPEKFDHWFHDLDEDNSLVVPSGRSGCDQKPVKNLFSSFIDKHVEENIEDTEEQMSWDDLCLVGNTNNYVDDDSESNLEFVGFVYPEADNICGTSSSSCLPDGIESLLYSAISGEDDRSKHENNENPDDIARLFFEDVDKVNNASPNKSGPLQLLSSNKCDTEILKKSTEGKLKKEANGCQKSKMRAVKGSYTRSFPEKDHPSVRNLRF